MMATHDFSALPLILGLLTLLVARTVFILFQHRFRRVSSSRMRNQSARTMVVLGSGGHTAEMMSLLSSIDRKFYRPILYVKASSDTTSEVRIRSSEESKKNLSSCGFVSIPRSREVGQSYFTSVGTTLYSMLGACKVVYQFCPDVVICNGPGTCVPLCFAVLLSHIFLFRPCKIIFVESFCRVDSLSFTGKLLYPIAARFVVQWPQLVNLYTRAEYIGRLC